MNKNHITVACIAIIDADERILIAKRKADKFLGGMWEFPGGKVEKGESPKEAIMREVKEELNIELCIECVSLVEVVTHEYEEFTATIHFYISRNWDGIPIANEGQVIKWCSGNTIENYLMPPANMQLVKSLLTLI